MSSKSNLKQILPFAHGPPIDFRMQFQFLKIIFTKMQALHVFLMQNCGFAMLCSLPKISSSLYKKKDLKKKISFEKLRARSLRKRGKMFC